MPRWAAPDRVANGLNRLMQDPSSQVPVALTPAPRALPPGLALWLMLGTMRASAGWGLLFVGGLTMALIVPRVDLSRSYDRQARGVLVGVERTNMRESRRAVYALRYTFVDDAGGTTHAGTAYSSDTAQPREVGSEVTVEYVADEPRRSRLVGTRGAQLPTFMILVAIVPTLIGVFLAGAQLVRGARHARVLRGHAIQLDDLPERVTVGPAGDLVAPRGRVGYALALPALAGLTWSLAVLRIVA